MDKLYLVCLPSCCPTLCVLQQRVRSIEAIEARLLRRRSEYREIEKVKSPISLVHTENERRQA
jgi:hypothetical protein